MPIDDATDRYLDRYGQSDDLDPYDDGCAECGEPSDECTCDNEPDPTAERPAIPDPGDPRAPR